MHSITFLHDLGLSMFGDILKGKLYVQAQQPLASKLGRSVKVSREPTNDSRQVAQSGAGNIS